MPEDINQEMKQLKSDIADLREDLASLVQAVRDTGTERGEKLYERATERAREAGGTAQRHATESYDAIGREVGQHPLASVAAAFATGFVVGMVLDRRR